METNLKVEESAMNHIGTIPDGRTWKCHVYNSKGELVFVGIGETKEEAETNAKLIAAAPDLLTALIEFVNLEKGNISDLKTTPQQRLVLAIDAIKKASNK